MKNDFEPRIVGFCCKWCAYTGADLAGTNRLQYPPNVSVVRTMCSGRVDPMIVAKALYYGADGVLVLGCHIGDCHYRTGNNYAMKRIAVLKRLLGYLGIEPNRVRIDWVSAAEGAKFARVVTEFTEEIRKLGPLSLVEGLPRQK